MVQLNLRTDAITSALRPLLVCVLLGVGCGHTVPMIPAKPNGHTAGDIERDERACAAQTASDKRRSLTYAACMIARGYTTYVEVDRIGMYVRALKRQRGPTVVSDLKICNPGGEGQTAGWIAGNIAMQLAIGVGVSSMSKQEADAMEASFSGCIVPRGYAAERWVGK